MNDSPYLDTTEGAAFVGLGQTKHPAFNFWRYIKRHGIKTYRRGRRVLVLKAALIERMQDDDKAARAKQRARWREKRAS